ncbi:MAG: hypothetical protein LBQ54_16235 [Planctomycetaceae bacterium]|jgi:hypothetical protein|nr:hypothetical protein [Planctomycetaceae bacterium]
MKTAKKVSHKREKNNKEKSATKSVNTLSKKTKKNETKKQGISSTASFVKTKSKSEETKKPLKKTPSERRTRELDDKKYQKFRRLTASQEQVSEKELVTIDRRTREKEEPHPTSKREKIPRRRQIDPTTCERDYTPEEIEFMGALDEYKRQSGRMFPTCSEILEVFRNLGYIKKENQESVEIVSVTEVAQNTAVSEIPRGALPGFRAVEKDWYTNFPTYTPPFEAFETDFE